MPALIHQTKTCKICFKKLNKTGIFDLISPVSCLCDECRNSFIVHLIRFTVLTHSALAIYEYDDWIKQELYTFKGCYDVELAPVFLEKIIAYLRIRYKGYVIVPVPSYVDDDKTRGFNHVEEMFSFLNLKMLHLIKKNRPYKQSDQTSQNRSKIKEVLSIENGECLYGKNVLIVDDIYTTGNTMETMIELIRPYKPRKIKVLVMAKTKFHQESKV